MELQENVSLASYTTLKIGGPARFFAHIRTESDLTEALAFAHGKHLAVFALGGGSNLVVPDQGFNGLVLHMALTPAIVRTEISHAWLFDVSAGTDWDALVRSVCEQGISGMECLAGIPGLVGGSPIQNIGAYGQEVSEIIDQVTAIDSQTGVRRELTRQECGFRYRHSIFNSTERGRYLVTAVRFRLPKETKPNLSYADLAPLRTGSPAPLDVYHFVRAIRDRKGMLIDPEHLHPDSRSAGSFFKNPIIPAVLLAHIANSLSIPGTEIPNWPLPDSSPEAADPAGPMAEDSSAQPEPRVKLAAAWLIERAGFPKGFVLGAAGISSRHTLALINSTGAATCADLLTLRDRIVSTVQQRFQVELQQEPVTLA